MRRTILRAGAVAAVVGVGLALTGRALAQQPAGHAAPAATGGSGMAPAPVADNPPAGLAPAPMRVVLSGLPSGGTAKERLVALLVALDAQAAIPEQSTDAETVIEAAKARAAFAAAIPAVGRLSEQQAADLLARLPVLVSGLDVGGAIPPTRADIAPLAAPSQGDQAQLEQFRAELDQLFVHYSTWSYLVPEDDRFPSMVQDGRNLVGTLTYEDLAAIQGQLADVPNWQSVLAPDIAALVPVPTVPESAVDGSRLGTTAKRHVLDGVATVTLSEDARTYGTYTPPRRATIDMGGQCSVEVFSLTLEQLEGRIIAESVLRYVALGLKFGTEIAPKDIKITVLGVTIDIPNPYTLLMGIARFIVNRVADGLAAELSVNTFCAQLVHWHQLIQHSQSLIDRSQDMLYQELEFHNRMTARYNALDLAERELWKMQVQLAIEENLLLDAPKADGSDENRIALFQFTDTVCFNPEELLPTPKPPFDPPVAPTPYDPLLPGYASPIDPPDRYLPLPTVAAFVGPADPREECGLNLVRRLVDETIQHNQQAGQNIHNALSLLAAGDSFLANYQYGEAYVRYRQAYQAAVKPDPSPTN